jgi:RNA polymerase sigma-70 factor (ECF subfamily)
MKKDFSAYTDKDLLKMMAGEKSEVDFGFKVIYHKYAPRVHAYCMRVLNSREEAEDIFQETFVKFFEKVKADFQSSSIQGFLITIARNLCLNYKRDKKSTVNLEDFHLIIDGNQQNEQKEIFDMIKMAMELIEFEYREPLILRLYDGLSYEEIAEICEISCENARKRVFRAKQKIRAIIEPNLKEMYN